MRSDQIKKGVERAPNRSLLYALGYTEEELSRPLVGIVSSWNEIVPGHMDLDKIVEAVKAGVRAAGGTPVVFPAIAVCDGIAMGHTGMLYSLPSRDIIADTVEYQVNAHCADALICIPNCDKVVPGMLMAALRLNIPTVFVSGGPMEAGTTVLPDGTVKKNTDLIDVMYASADDNLNEEDLLAYEKTVCPTCGSCAGMFTANSMNCLTEAIGLALPGNGTILASHSYRKDLFKRAAEQVVKIAKQYYDDDDDSVLPRSIATKKAFENAMTMDVAMGGSTNTVLHILAMAQSADVDFTLDDIERISHTVPCICKASPSGKWEISDVHRAGGITGILGELDRAGKLHTNVHSIDYPTLEAKLADWDIMRPTCTEEAQQMYKAAPGHIISPEPWTHTTLFDSLDRDRVNGAIHDIDHPAVTEGGLAVLRGNLAPDGCVVKTAGVPKEIWTFRGPALVVESQEQAIEVILNDTLKPGMALVIRYEGPKGGPGMQEMLYPTSFVKGKGIGKQVAMLTDGRYSGGSSGLAIGHIAPEAANKGPIALIKNGDIINIDIPNRTVNVELSDEELAQRRAELEAGDGYVAHRDRKVSQALKAYAAFARSADKGATRDPELIDKLSVEEMPASSRRYPWVAFDADREAGKDILEVRGISKTIDGEKVLDNVSFIVRRGDKIAFISDNELAMTTLFQILMGEMKPDEGSFKWGVTTSQSYFPKDNNEFFEGHEENMLDWIAPYSRTDTLESTLRGFLGRMLFSGDDVYKPVRVLSGGEKVRLMLARMMLFGSNVLVIDQPTNHLDLESITAVNNGVRDFKGTVLFASHDHEFVQTIATRIIEIREKGVLDKECTYDEFLEFRETYKG